MTIGQDDKYDEARGFARDDDARRSYRERQVLEYGLAEPFLSHPVVHRWVTAFLDGEVDTLTEALAEIVRELLSTDGAT